MKNIDMKVEGTILTITVDLSKDFGPSSSGKTNIIATTEGNVSIPGRDEKVGLNILQEKNLRSSTRIGSLLTSVQWPFRSHF